MENIAVEISEPSIGQLEYLKYLQVMSAVQKPSFMVVELDLPSYDSTVIGKTAAYFLERHDSLRTVFPLVKNEIRQVVLPATDRRFQPEYITIENEAHNFNDIRKACFDKAAATFADIGHGPLVRLIIFKRGKNCLFSLVIHHVICDEWSCSLIRDELMAVYGSYLAGREPGLPPLHVTLRDYCERQNAWLRRNRDEISLFWKRRLQGFNTVFDMSGFHGRQRTFTVAELDAILDRPDVSSYTCMLSRPLFLKMTEMATEKKTRLFSLVYACLFLFLYAYTGKKRLLVPALVTDRFVPDHQLLIGCLLGSIYLKAEVKEQMTINEFITEMEKEITTVSRYIIYSHGFLGLDGNGIRNCCDMYINYLRKEQEIYVDPYKMGHHTEDYAINYPVYCLITEYKDGMVFVWKYNRFLFGSRMIEDMVSCFEKLVRYVTADGNRPIGDLKDLARIPEIIL